MSKSRSRSRARSQGPGASASSGAPASPSPMGQGRKSTLKSRVATVRQPHGQRERAARPHHAPTMRQRC